MPFVKWTFWCKTEEGFVNEMSFGLKKVCALRGKKKGNNTRNDLKVIQNPAFKGFLESFCHYTVKICRSLMHAFYFRAPGLSDSY